MGLTLATPPAVEPLSIVEARAHLRVDHGFEDPLIESLIKAARATVEQRRGIALIAQVWDWTLDRIDARRLCRVPIWPLQSVMSFKYLDAAGVEQTLDPSVYRVDAASRPGRITLAYGQTWPDTYPAVAAVTVRFTAGYGAAGADVDENIRHALRLLVGHYYRNREQVITGTTAADLPEGVDALLPPALPGFGA